MMNNFYKKKKKKKNKQICLKTKVNKISPNTY